MDTIVNTTIIWIMAITSGLMAGTYLAFSSFIMVSFNTLQAAKAIQSMNAINITIVKSPFMPLFFSSTIIAALLMITGVWHWGATGADRAVLAGAIYFIGMFLITAAFNVPLNNQLAAWHEADTGPDNEAEREWQTYQVAWTRWNHVRTAASTATFALCVSLLADGPKPANDYSRSLSSTGHIQLEHSIHGHIRKR